MTRPSRPTDAAQRQRLASRSHGVRAGASWELCLERWLESAGAELERHPPVPGLTRRPDLLAAVGEAAVYVEATATGSGTMEGHRQPTPRLRLHDVLISRCKQKSRAFQGIDGALLLAVLCLSPHADEAVVAGAVAELFAPGNPRSRNVSAVLVGWDVDELDAPSRIALFPHPSPRAPLPEWMTRMVAQWRLRQPRSETEDETANVGGSEGGRDGSSAAPPERSMGMDSSLTAHGAARPAGDGAAWPPEQVQSGADSGEPPAQRAAAVLARGLGWFSIGLGVVQVVAPRRVAALVGAPVTAGTIAATRLMGAREVAHGLGILSSRRPAPWLWSRVAGDALDMGLLGRALRLRGSNRARVAGAMAAVAGTAAADVFDGVQLAGRREGTSPSLPMRVKAAVTIDRTAADIYRYWRDFENLPDVMTHLERVEDLGDGRSRWRVRAPLGTSASWEAEVVEDVPERLIAWQSMPGCAIENSGEVRLRPAPGDRGTELHVLLRYEAPAGAVGAAVAKLFGDDPVQQVKDDLRRFKQVMETGQVVRSDGAPRGTDARLQPKQRPARPPRRE